MTKSVLDALEAAWLPARRDGVIGNDSIRHLLTHAAGFLPAACGVLDRFQGLDLGTGAGLPGVLLALLRPQSEWLLVDASERRCDYAEAAVRAGALADRVDVCHARAEDLGRDPQWRGRAELVVARSFGPATEVAECGLPLLRPESGRLVVSASEAGATTWMEATPAGIPLRVDEVRRTTEGTFVELGLSGPLPDRFPRRTSARRRDPLF